MRLDFVEPGIMVRLLLLGVAAFLVYGAATQVVWYRQSRPPVDAEVTTVVVDDLVSHRDCNRRLGSRTRHDSCVTDVTGIEFETADGRTARARTSVDLEVGDEVHVFRDDQERWQVVEGHSRTATTVLAALAGVLALGLVGSAWRAPVLRRSGSRVSSPEHAGSPPPAA